MPAIQADTWHTSLQAVSRSVRYCEAYTQLLMEDQR
jgi:hypothetical protein